MVDIKVETKKNLSVADNLVADVQLRSSPEISFQSLKKKQFCLYLFFYKLDIKRYKIFTIFVQK